MASTMQLEFAQAMSDFKIMFPDMDRDVIEAVLRANQGAVDATIDQLLQMSTDNQNEKLRNELENVSPQRSLINLSDSDTEAASRNRQPATGQLIDVDDIDGISGGSVVDKSLPSAGVLLNIGTNSPNHSTTGASPKVRPPAQLQSQKSSQGSTPKRLQTNRSQTTGINRRWNPPMLLPLPSTFLRINPVGSGGGNTIALPYDPNRDFDLPDEQFAMMLQNEEFMNQLRINQEFMNALEKEHAGKGKPDGDADFKERLKHMGKMSRKKFLQMARVFTWQRNKKVTTAKQIDSLPLKEEPSDDEENHQHQQQHTKSNTSSDHSHTQSSQQQPQRK
ncbi:CUE domain-containing protein 1-like [Musca vetustissima]|uniref:CUE domain-containing protein 1-like n=1 Tax=Musca vetustissima TaxID=27455 RepID=UPI002AB7EF49|nr:CUE domain-containing protein 1-like [Musca vetustissima]